MAVLDANEIMFRAFEPKVQNRFVMYFDDIPSFMVKTASTPSFTDESIKLITLTATEKSVVKESGMILISLFTILSLLLVLKL